MESKSRRRTCKRFVELFTRLLHATRSNTRRVQREASNRSSPKRAAISRYTASLNGIESTHSAAKRPPYRSSPKPLELVRYTTNPRHNPFSPAEKFRSPHPSKLNRETRIALGTHNTPISFPTKKKKKSGSPYLKKEEKKRL